MNTFTEPQTIANLLAELDYPWWICGGWAIDLFLNRPTRPHKDIDVAVRRQDQHAIQRYLTTRGWMLEKAVDGILTPWVVDEYISLPVHTIWCKHGSFNPTFFELLFNEVDSSVFRFRRDQSITRGVTQMTQQTASDIPILCPEIVLLYKASNSSDESNTADFLNVLPWLSIEQRSWLYRSLEQHHPGHTWLRHFP